MVKNPPASAGDGGDSGSIPGSGRSPGVGNGTKLSRILGWRIQWTEETGGLQSSRLQRGRHNWAAEHAHRKLPSLFLPCEGTSSQFWTRKHAFTRHCLCQHLDIRLPTSKTMRNKYLFIKTPTLWHFCYSSPNRLKQKGDSTFMPKALVSH